MRRAKWAAALMLLVHSIAAPAVYPGAGWWGLAVVLAATTVSVGLLVILALQEQQERLGRRLMAALTACRSELMACQDQVTQQTAELGRRAEHEQRLRAEWEQVSGAFSQNAAAVQAALEHLVRQQLPALVAGAPVPPLILGEELTDLETASLIEQVAVQVSGLAKDGRDRRESMRLVVVSLARRLQASALEICGQAEQMLRRMPHDPVVLEVSSRVQHAAMQQARLAQSVVTLAGEWPGQQWQSDEPLVDVVRAASGRITSFERVQVTGDREIAVVASVVEPVIHLLAELLANAAQSSPPTTTVQVQVREVQRGAVIEVDDAGLGLREHELAEFRLIAGGHRVVGMEEMGGVPQTGLAVVGQYARRHGISVDLTESPYGGIRAIVLVPGELVTTVPLASPPGALPPPTGPTPRADQHPPQRPGSGQDAGADAGAPEPSRPAPDAEPNSEPGAGPSSRPNSGPGSGLGGLPRRKHRRGSGPQAAPPAARPAAAAGPERSPAQEGVWMAAFMAGSGHPSGHLDVFDAHIPAPGSGPGTDQEDKDDSHG